MSLRPIINQAAEARRVFIRELGSFIESARHGNTQMVAQGAGRIGREQVAVFRDASSRLKHLHTPRACTSCHEAVSSWIEMHVAACEVLIDVGTKGDLKRLREAQGLLAEGRRFAQRFNGAYTALVAELRQRVEEVTAARRERQQERAAETRPSQPRGRR